MSHQARTCASHSTLHEAIGPIGNSGYFPQRLGALDDYVVTGTMASTTYYNALLALNPMYNMRTIFGGQKRTSAHYQTATALVDGQMAMAPNGLGWLVYGGYMNDVKPFFCPTAQDSMPCDTYRLSTATGATAADLPKAATLLSQVKRTGGFDRNAMLRGKWSWQPVFRENLGWPGRVLLSNYNYRNVGALIAPARMTAGWDATGQNYDRQFRMKYTSPVVTVTAGCPPFKTTKILGGRAIVSDSFNSDNVDADYVAAGFTPGKGVYAHREGYNVLYGDGSVKWYGDPQQKILWWTHDRISGHTGDIWYWVQHAMVQNIIAEGTGTTGQALYATPWATYKEGVVTTWHNFDVEAGIDVGAQ